MSAAALALVALLGAAVLAGCTASPTTPATSSTPTRATESPAAVVGPQSALPIGCNQVLPLADVQSRFTAHVTLSDDESATPHSLLQAAFRQAGALNCDWTAGPASSAGNDGVDIVILPDAVDAAQAYQQFAGIDDSPSCADRGTLDCSVSFTAGSYWVVLGMRDGSTSNSPRPLDELKKVVSASVEGAGAPRPVSSPPAGALTGDAFCDATSSPSRVAAAFQVPANQLTLGGAGGGPGPDVTAFAKTGTTSCSWLANSPAGFEVDIQVLPGGAWATPGMTSWVGRSGDIPRVGRAVVVGAQTARVGCSSGGCVAYLSSHESLVSVFTSSVTDPAAFESDLAALIAERG